MSHERLGPPSALHDGSDFRLDITSRSQLEYVLT
jgi:hypothetical protein